MKARLPVTLTRPVRYFIIRERSVEEAGNLIIGKKVFLESPMRICIEFQLRDVALFNKKGLPCCVIVEDIGAPNLLRKLHTLKYFEIIK